MMMVTGIIAVVIAILLGARRQMAKRTEALQSIAQQAGWSFAPDDAPAASLGVAALPLFERGRARLARNVMRTSDFSSQTLICDYRYTVGSGKSQSTIVQTIVHIKSARLALPPFALAPENILHKVSELFGYQDLDFESNPDFSKRYLLRSKTDEARVRELFSPSVLSYFEQRPTLVDVEGNSDEMVVHRTSRTLKPEDLRAFVEDALTIARQLQR